MKKQIFWNIFFIFVNLIVIFWGLYFVLNGLNEQKLFPAFGYLFSGIALVFAGGSSAIIRIFDLMDIYRHKSKKSTSDDFGGMSEHWCETPYPSLADND
jgi:hypothetical protein